MGNGDQTGKCSRRDAEINRGATQPTPLPNRGQPKNDSQIDGCLLCHCAPSSDKKKGPGTLSDFGANLVLTLFIHREN